MNTKQIDQLFSSMVEANASDLYLTVGCPATLRTEEGMTHLTPALTSEQVNLLIDQVLTQDQRMEFDATLEFNSAINWQDGAARFRVNALIQQQQPAMVIRRINTKIPTFNELNLSDAYEKLAMEKRGLVLLVGPTGSGKSSSLAAMIGHRNRNSEGHIITIEDPIEFVHEHQKSIVTQRDVGVDTFSFGMALKNALRQRPDVVLIGEIRDRETMEHAINFAETGHLCLATLHANNSYQAIERILSFFPEEKHRQILMNLALNLRGILSQRLINNSDGGKIIVSEVLLNEGLVRQLIEEGKTKDIRPLMERSGDVGMQTFDDAMLKRYIAGQINQETALAESDNPQNLKLRMKQAVVSRSVDLGLPPTQEDEMSAGLILERKLEI